MVSAALQQGPADSPARRYIDLARLGRVDGWSVAKAVLRIVLYYVLTIIVLSVAYGAIAAFAWPQFMRLTKALGAGGELLLILIVFLPLLWAIRDAVVYSHRRPFLSLIAPDLRFDARRVLIGAGAWLAAILLCWAVATLISVASGAPEEPADDWSFDWSLLPVALVALLVIPIQAGTEELLCRGWLTQLLGQAIRSPVVVALLVAAFFSLLHGVGSLVSFAYFMIVSLAFSAISLRDGRLELAIGAHAAQNLFVLLVASPLESVAHKPSLLDSDPAHMPWTLLPDAVAIGVVGYVLASWLARRLKARG
jgi:membrane protease YdiL (CAAX protease family)